MRRLIVCTRHQITVMAFEVTEEDDVWDMEM